jgi:mannose-6-phosphate isomerase-like protein (cupin superfamily)
MPPGERYIIRASFEQTNGAYSLLEVVADHLNGAPEHVHQNEDEHILVLEGKAHFVTGDRRVDLIAGSALAAAKGTVHAWCNLLATPLRMLVVYTPGGGRRHHDAASVVRGPRVS